MSSLRATVTVFAALFAVSDAVEPALQHLFPVAGQQGTTITVTGAGKMEPWPPQIWVDSPGIVFKPAAKKGQFEVQIAKDAAPGPHLVRSFNQDGVSSPRFFVVSAEPELLDAEPNDDWSVPQKITALPATISGRLSKGGDVDSFAVTLKKGQPFTASLEGYVLGSAFDGLLRITDDRGTVLAFNHDGRTLDPLLVWTAPHDGVFIVQLMGFVYPATASVGLAGGDGCVYRLHLSSNAQLRVALPPHRADWGKEIAEQEPNDSANNAQSIDLPCSAPSAIGKPGDEDRFAFTAAKGKIYELKIVGARGGSPLDAWLKIENKVGKELARNDDAEGSRDPLLIWTAPADGSFIAAVGDLTHRGGEEFLYRLTCAEAQPAVTAIAANHFVNVAAGKTGEIKTTVTRTNGMKARLVLAVKNLPEGISATEVEVPDKSGEVTIKLTAVETAVAASQPFQLVLRETESGREHPVVFSMTTMGENNGVPQGYTELVINSTDQLWLTVIAAPKSEAPKTETPPATASR